MVVMGGWETFTRNGVSQEWGVWFYNGRLEIFKVFLHSWQRGANPLILWRPPILPICPFSNFIHPLPHFPVTSNPHLHCSFCCNVSLPEWVMGWSYHIWCAILLNDNVDLHMSSLGSLVPEGPWYVCFMQQDIKFAEV